MIVLILSAMTFAGFLSTANQIYRIKTGKRITDGPYTAESLDMFRYIKDRSEPDEVIAFYKPRAMRLMTDRNSIMTSNTSDVKKADYFVYDKKQGRGGNKDQVNRQEIDTLVSQGLLRGIYSNNRFEIYSNPENQ
jgi:hypothetical protein